MAVGFPVRGQGQQARPGRSDQTLPELFAVFQKPLKGHGLGQGAVIKEHGQAAPGRQADGIGQENVQAEFINVAAVASVQVGHGRGLSGRQNHEAKSRVGHGLQGGCVHCGFRKPKSLGITLKASLEISPGPGQLHFLVQRRSQRHDHVMMALGHGVAVAPATEALPIGFQDPGVADRVGAFQPGKKRRP